MSFVDNLDYIIIGYVHHFDCASDVFKIICSFWQIIQASFSLISLIADEQSKFVIKFILLLIYCRIFDIFEYSVDLTSLYHFVYSQVRSPILCIFNFLILSELFCFFDHLFQPVDFSFRFFLAYVLRMYIGFFHYLCTNKLRHKNPLKP